MKIELKWGPEEIDGQGFKCAGCSWKGLSFSTYRMSPTDRPLSTMVLAAGWPLLASTGTSPQIKIKARRIFLVKTSSAGGFNITKAGEVVGRDGGWRMNIKY